MTSRDVVLDEHDRDAVGGERAEQRRELDVSVSSWPDAGSSSSSTSGWWRGSGRARPGGLAGGERVDPRVGDVASSPTRSMIASTTSAGLSLSCDQPLRTSAATRMFSRTLSRLNSSRRWNVRPSPRRARWVGESRVTSLAVEADPALVRRAAAR